MKARFSFVRVSEDTTAYRDYAVLPTADVNSVNSFILRNFVDVKVSNFGIDYSSRDYRHISVYTDTVDIPFRTKPCEFCDYDA